jgi:hypothetical protein
MNQHWLLSFVRLFLAITGTADIGETIRYSANPSEPTQLGRSTLTVISVLIGDGVIVSPRLLPEKSYERLQIHRLWLIHNRNWLSVTIPIISWLGELSRVSAFRQDFIPDDIAPSLRPYCRSALSRSSVNFLVSAKGRITTNWVLTVM